MSLDVSNISKTYDKGESPVVALDGVSFSVACGEVVALVGNNGAGKSTLMSIAAGLMAADEGTVTIMGHETTANGGTPTHHLGLAPQEEALYPTLSARRNLAYFGSLAGLRGDPLDRRVAEVAGDLLLSELLDRKARELSGGQRRRLHTGLALMHDPEVLLLDEPTVGVDIDARLQLLQFVRDSAEAGAAVLYSTHQMTEVEQLASRVVVLDHGRVLAKGTVDDLVATHSPPLGELRFNGSTVALPGPLSNDLDQIRTTQDDQTVAVVRLPEVSTTVADLVDQLGDEARGQLVSAQIHAPSFENAYVRITRRVDASGTPVTPSPGTGGQATSPGGDRGEP